MFKLHFLNIIFLLTIGYLILTVISGTLFLLQQPLYNLLGTIALNILMIDISFIIFQVVDSTIRYFYNKKVKNDRFE